MFLYSFLQYDAPVPSSPIRHSKILYKEKQCGDKINEYKKMELGKMTVCLVVWNKPIIFIQFYDGIQ